MPRLENDNSSYRLLVSMARIPWLVITLAMALPLAASAFEPISPWREPAIERERLTMAARPRFGWLAGHGFQVMAATASLAGLLALWNLSLRLELRRRRRDLADTRDVFASAIAAMPDALIELSEQGRILAVHTPHRDLLTQPAAEQLNRRLAEVLPGAAAATVLDALAEAGRQGFSRGREIQVPLPGGPAWFELSVSRRQGASQQDQRFLLLSRDITARKQDAERIQRLKRLYTALSLSNQAMTREEDGTALLQEICRIAVTFGEMKMAWVGLIDTSGQQLQPVAWAGEGTDYLRGLHIGTRADDPTSRGPAGRALTTDRPYWCQDFQNDPISAPWHERARRYGWGAVGALPLHREGRVIGTITLYRVEPDGFDLQSQELLIEMVRDIDFALQRINSQAIRRQLEQEVTASQEKYRQLSESIHDVIWTLDAESLRYLYVSPSVQRLLGYTPEEMIDQPFAASLLPESARRMEEQIRAEIEEFRQGLRDSTIVSVDEVEQSCKDGSSMWTEVVTHLVRHPDTGRLELHGVTRDITERKFASEQIRRLAYSDQLTGLPNRVLLRERFRLALALTHRQGAHLALLNLDLDNFKTINDNLGHTVGDRLLKEVARRLEGQLRPGDTLSRSGGDEFLMLLPDTDANTTLELVRRLVLVVSEPYQLGQQSLFVTASIGIALYPEDGATMETLMSNADAAVHQAKQDSRNTFRFFTASVQQRSARQLRLSNALHQSLEREDFQLLYQPQMDLVSGRIIGAEALLRWPSTELGSVSPAEFVPVAEANGLIVPLGDWVLRQAVRDAVQWCRPDNQAGAPPLTVSVNISAVQFRDSGLTGRILRILEEERLAPARLVLELTETVTLDNPEKAILLMDRLFREGIQLAIDDFGTGYSSLSYLKRMRAHKLKIDQSFVRGLAHDGDDHAIVLAIINLARSLGLRTIAEGVETSEQMELLRRAGCDEIQGFWVSSPLTSEAFQQQPL
jgi:diguanylate cyclase (GGDEF)-like protein/PAS domain S-box-containing protein